VHILSEFKEKDPLKCFSGAVNTLDLSEEMIESIKETRANNLKEY
jgi:hypothetical protein